MFKKYIGCAEKFLGEMSTHDVICLHLCAAALGVFLGASASDKCKNGVKVLAFIGYVAALSRVISGVVKKLRGGECCCCDDSSDIEYDDSDIGEESISF